MSAVRDLWVGIRDLFKRRSRHTFPQRPKLAWDVCTTCGMVSRAEAYAQPRCYGKPLEGYL